MEKDTEAHIWEKFSGKNVTERTQTLGSESSNYRKSVHIPEVNRDIQQLHNVYIHSLGADALKTQWNEEKKLELEREAIQRKQNKIGKILRRKIKVVELEDGGLSISMDQEWDTSTWSDEYIQAGCDALILIFYDSDFSSCSQRKERALYMLQKLLFRHSSAVEYIRKNIEMMVGKSVNKLIRGGRCGGLLDLLYVLNSCKATYILEMSHSNFNGRAMELLMQEAKLAAILIQHSYRSKRNMVLSNNFKDSSVKQALHNVITVPEVVSSVMVTTEENMLVKDDEIEHTVPAISSTTTAATKKSFDNDSSDVQMSQLRLVNGRSAELRAMWRSMHWFQTIEAQAQIGGYRGPSHVGENYTRVTLEIILYLISKSAGRFAHGNREDVVRSNGCLLLSTLLGASGGHQYFPPLAACILSYLSLTTESYLPMIGSGCIGSAVKHLKYLRVVVGVIGSSNSGSTDNTTIASSNNKNEKTKAAICTPLEVYLACVDIITHTAVHAAGMTRAIGQYRTITAAYEEIERVDYTAFYRALCARTGFNNTRLSLDARVTLGNDALLREFSTVFLTVTSPHQQQHQQQQQQQQHPELLCRLVQCMFTLLCTDAHEAVVSEIVAQQGALLVRLIQLLHSENADIGNASVCLFMQLCTQSSSRLALARVKVENYLAEARNRYSAITAATTTSSSSSSKEERHYGDICLQRSLMLSAALCRQGNWRYYDPLMLPAVVIGEKLMSHDDDDCDGLNSNGNKRNSSRKGFGIHDTTTTTTTTAAAVNCSIGSNTIVGSPMKSSTALQQQQPLSVNAAIRHNLFLDILRTMRTTDGSDKDIQEVEEEGGGGRSAYNQNNYSSNINNILNKSRRHIITSLLPSSSRYITDAIAERLSISDWVVLPNHEHCCMAMSQAAGRCAGSGALALVEFLCHSHDENYYESLPLHEAAATCVILEGLSACPSTACSAYLPGAIKFMSKYVYLCKYLFLGKTMKNSMILVILHGVKSAFIAIGRFALAISNAAAPTKPSTAATISSLFNLDQTSEAVKQQQKQALKSVEKYVHIVRESQLVASSLYFMNTLSIAHPRLNEQTQALQRIVGIGCLDFLNMHASVLVQLEEEYKNNNSNNNSSSSNSSISNSSSKSSITARLYGSSSYLQDLHTPAAAVVNLISFIKQVHRKSPQLIQIFIRACDFLGIVTRTKEAGSMAIQDWKIFDSLCIYLPSPLSAILPEEVANNLAAVTSALAYNSDVSIDSSVLTALEHDQAIRRALIEEYKIGLMDLPPSLFDLCANLCRISGGLAPCLAEGFLRRALDKLTLLNAKLKKNSTKYSNKHRKPEVDKDWNELAADLSALLHFVRNAANFNHPKYGSTNDIILHKLYEFVPLCKNIICTQIHTKRPRTDEVLLAAYEALAAVARDTYRINQIFEQFDMYSVIRMELAMLDSFPPRGAHAAVITVDRSCFGLTSKYIVDMIPQLREPLGKVARIYPELADIVRDAQWSLTKCARMYKQSVDPLYRPDKTIDAEMESFIRTGSNTKSGATSRAYSRQPSARKPENQYLLLSLKNLSNNPNQIDVINSTFNSSAAAAIQQNNDYNNSYGSYNSSSNRITVQAVGSETYDLIEPSTILKLNSISHDEEEDEKGVSAKLSEVVVDAVGSGTYMHCGVSNCGSLRLFNDTPHQHGLHAHKTEAQRELELKRLHLSLQSDRYVPPPSTNVNKNKLIENSNTPPVIIEPLVLPTSVSSVQLCEVSKLSARSSVLRNMIDDRKTAAGFRELKRYPPPVGTTTTTNMATETTTTGTLDLITTTPLSSSSSLLLNKGGGTPPKRIVSGGSPPSNMNDFNRNSNTFMKGTSNSIQVGNHSPLTTKSGNMTIKSYYGSDSLHVLPPSSPTGFHSRGGSNFSSCNSTRTTTPRNNNIGKISSTSSSSKMLVHPSTISRSSSRSSNYSSGGNHHSSNSSHSNNKANQSVMVELKMRVLSVQQLPQLMLTRPKE